MNQQLRGNVLVMGETAATGTPDNYHCRRHQCRQHQHQRHADCHHSTSNNKTTSNEPAVLRLVLPAEKVAAIATTQKMQKTAAAVPAALTSLLLNTAAQQQSPGASTPLIGSSNNDSWGATASSTPLSLLLEQRGNSIGPTSPSAAPAACSTASGVVSVATTSASTSILGSRQDARMATVKFCTSSTVTAPTLLTQARAQQPADTLPLPHPQQTAMTSPRTAATFM
eukprot:CAMPEP_0119550534 /NCGR_PEP_ID=MMETSP1352-20130426/4037_1 /TAXON_ID=265584 /ORGANISM="Stauroneis constricta, Strain CCMP1120" /LENGTH=225 /DNA_ID=CAMNT_0007596421 /DNA_START=34 /DNA_END=708 /DNA_ORIENTATION=+